MPSLRNPRPPGDLLLRVDDRQHPRTLQLPPHHEPAADMRVRRVSLTTEQADYVAAALRSYAAGHQASSRRAAILRLALRIDEGRPGNPAWVWQDPGYLLVRGSPEPPGGQQPAVVSKEGVQADISSYVPPFG